MNDAIANNCRTLERPRSLERDSRSNSTYARFVIRPLERGFGTTLGNGLRRVLLSTLQGAALRTVRFDGVVPETDTIPGVVEDVTDLALNFKGVLVASAEPTTGRLDRAAKNSSVVVRAGDLQLDGGARVLNPHHVLGTLAEGGSLQATVTVGTGRGYVPADTPRGADGTITLDALFSPIQKVRYQVTNARKGQRTDYDKLTLEIWTDGSVRPEDALVYAARVLREQMQVFINFEEDPESLDSYAGGSSEWPEALYLAVGDLELSVRSANCLKNANIEYLWQLVDKSEAEMLKIKNLGRKSLNEIKDLLVEHKLTMGMDLTGFPKDR